MAGRLVAADQDQQALLDDRLVVEPLAVDLGVTQDAHEIVLRWFGAAVGDDAPLELAEPAHRRRPRLCDFGRRIGRRGADEIIRPTQQLVVRLGREPEHVGDEQQRQRRGDVPHEVARTFRRDAIDDVGADTPDGGLVVAHSPRRETPADEAAAPRVFGRVHRDHHRQVAAVRARGAVTREGCGVLLDREDVVVARQRPHLVLRVPVRRRVLAHPRPVGQRLAGVPVTVEEVERSGRTAVHGAASLGDFDFRRRAGERPAQLVLRDFFGRGLRKLRHDV